MYWFLFLTLHSDILTLHPHFPKAGRNLELIIGCEKSLLEGEEKKDDLEGKEIHINVWSIIAHHTYDGVCYKYRAWAVYEAGLRIRSGGKPQVLKPMK